MEVSDDKRTTGVHPFDICWTKKKDGSVYSRNDKIKHCKDYLLRSPGQCPKLTPKKSNESMYYTCKCLDRFRQEENDNEREAVATYMVYYWTGCIQHRNIELVDIVKESPGKDVRGHNVKRFRTPNRTMIRSTVATNETDENLNEHLICKGALGYILKFRQRRWESIKDMAYRLKIFWHGNKGKRWHGRDNFKRNVQPSIDAFTEKHVKELEVSRREFNKASNDGKKLVTPITPIRQLYCQYLDSCGWDVKFNKHNDPCAVPRKGTRQRPICGISKFRRTVCAKEIKEKKRVKPKWVIEEYVPKNEKNYNTMTVKELKIQLKLRGKKVSGKKKELLHRLLYS